MLAGAIGQALGELEWCGVPFCGGCAELPHVRTRSGVANDLHRHVINLARTVRDDVLIEQLINKLRDKLFHVDELKGAQLRCRERENVSTDEYDPCAPPDVSWASDYFVSTWMSRGGVSGTRNEFVNGLSIRWSSAGGGSALRFRNAIDSLMEWSLALQRWTFTCIDAFAFIGKVKDQAGHGLYIDAPWPDLGDRYVHRVGNDDQCRLAEVLSRFKKTRVVVRFGDHERIRELYTDNRWHWIRKTSKNQNGSAVCEALIVNHPVGGQLWR